MRKVGIFYEHKPTADEWVDALTESSLSEEKRTLNLFVESKPAICDIQELKKRNLDLIILQVTTPSRVNAPNELKRLGYNSETFPHAGACSFIYLIRTTENPLCDVPVIYTSLPNAKGLDETRVIFDKYKKTFYHDQTHYKGIVPLVKKVLELTSTDN